jgi:hypothetical protein
MPFHVELRRGHRRASAFNLDLQTLQQVVLEPWIRNHTVELGEKEWEPGESELQILEGPQLEGADLAMGRGWHNAQRVSEDVTAQLLETMAAEAARIAVLAASPSAGEEVGGILTQLGVEQADWDQVRARILAASGAGAAPPTDLGVAAVLLVGEPEPDPVWQFEAGLAVGALGARAIAVQLGDEPPPAALRDLAVIRVDPANQAAAQALAERLRVVTRSV